MKHITITTEKGNHEIAIPTRADEVTFDMFNRARKHEKTFKVFSELCGIPEEVWELEGAVELYSLCEQCLSFFGTDEVAKLPEYIHFEGELIRLKVDLLKDQVQKYESLKIAIKQHEKDALEAMPLACAIYIQPMIHDSDFDGDVAVELADEVKKMPYREVIGIGNHLFSSFATIERWHSENCAESDSSAEYERAGFSALQSDFGHVAWLNQITKNPVEQEEILKLDVYTVYRQLQFMSHQYACESRLQKARAQQAKARK